MVAEAAQGHYGRLQPYEVFARHSKDPARYHLGEVRAAGPADAEVYAYTMYDERRWEELFVVPRSALIAVIREDEEGGA